MPKHLIAPILFFSYACTVLMLHTAPISGDKRGGEEVVSSLRLTHVLHTGMFLPWGLASSFYVYSKRNDRFRRAACWILLGLVFAACAEGSQITLSYRSFNLTDLLFNITGVIAGSCALLALRPWAALFERARTWLSAVPSQSTPKGHPSYNTDK